MTRAPIIERWQTMHRSRKAMEWLIFAAAITLGIFATAWLTQERLIFFPQPITSTAHLPARAEPFQVVGADSKRLHGWVVKGATVPGPTVIYFGGNAEEVSWTLADPHWPREWTIAGLNYRGYGESEGTPGEPELTADALAIYDALTLRQDIDRSRVVVFGRSLGTALAAHLAAARPVAGAILVSPYDSLTAIGKEHYPWLPVSLLLRHRFNALADASRNRMPLLAVVGEADAIIPPERSRALFDAWAGPKTWLVVPGAGHNSLGASEIFWDGIAHFLAER
jgi:pimeloyl-ACP methyl ester carboxylesterase